MAAPDLLINGLKAAKERSPEILTALGASGVLVTTYLTGKASFKACDVIRTAEVYEDFSHEERKARITRRTKLVWKLYIPPAASATVSVACIFGLAKAGSNRTAAAVTAYSLTERAFSEYREKVVEEIGKPKEQAIRDSIAQDRVAQASDVLVLGSGDVLCYEMLTGRYFMCNMEKLKQAKNEINAQINRQLYVTLSAFYDHIDLPYTSQSSAWGWNSDKLMDLEFSTVLSPKGEPCLAFDYNYYKVL